MGEIKKDEERGRSPRNFPLGSSAYLQVRKEASFVAHDGETRHQHARDDFRVICFCIYPAMCCLWVEEVRMLRLCAPKSLLPNDLHVFSYRSLHIAVQLICLSEG